MFLYDYTGGIIDVSEAITPQENGAKADGITDDYSAINKTIADNPGATIYFPEGRYMVSNTIKTYPSDTNFVNLIFHPNAQIVPTSKMNYVFDLGGIEEEFAYDAGKRKKYFCGGNIFADNGNVNVSAIHIDNNTHDVEMCNVTVRTLDCSGLLIGQSGVTTLSTDCYIHHCVFRHNQASNTVSGIIVRSFDNSLSDIRVYYYKNGIEVIGGGTYLHNIHTLATTLQDDSTSFIIGAETHMSQTYGDSESTFIKAINAPTIIMTDCQYYSYWDHDVVFFDMESYAKLKVNGLILGCRENNEYIGMKVPYSSFAQQFNKTNFDIGGLIIANAQYLRNGDPLKGMQSSDKQPVFKTTTLNTNTWYHIGTFAVDDSGWINVEFTLNNRKTEIPLNIICSSSGLLSGDIGSGKVVSDDTGVYQLGFSVANGDFDSSVDYPLVDVYLRINSGGTKSLQRIFLKSNRENPLSTPSTLPTVNIQAVSITPSNIYTVNCEDGTLTAN